MSRTIAGTRTAAGQRQIVRDFGKSLKFNGTTGALQLNTPGSLNITGSAVTLTAWHKSLDLSTNRTPICHGNFGSTIQYMMMVQGNKLRMEVTTSVGGNVGLQGAITIKKGEWTFLACVYDGANIRLYVNGVPDLTMAKTGNLTTSSDPVNLAIRSGTAEWISGWLDDVRIYNTNLSAQQINDLFYGTNPPTTNLQGWWKMDEGTGTTTADGSGNGGTMSFVNSPTWSTDVFMVPRTAAP